MAIRANQSQSETMRGNQRQSVVLRGERGGARRLMANGEIVACWEQLCPPTRLEPGPQRERRARRLRASGGKNGTRSIDLLVHSEPGPQKGVSPTFLWEHLWIYAQSKYLKSKTRKSSRRRQDVLCLLDQCLRHASFPCLLNGVRKFVHSSSELRLVEILGSESLHHLFDCP